MRGTDDFPGPPKRSGVAPGGNLRATALILMGGWCRPVPTPHQGRPGRRNEVEARKGQDEMHCADGARKFVGQTDRGRLVGNAFPFETAGLLSCRDLMEIMPH